MHDNKSIIPIVFACNKKYFKHVSVAILSIILNHNTHYKLKFYIISKDFNSRESIKCRAFFKKLSLEIQFLHLQNTSALEGFPTQGARYSLDIYSRLYIPMFFKNIYEKVIYLDGDTITLQDIENLYNTDIGNTCCGAIADAALTRHAKRLRLPHAHTYFNSGVLLINIPKWNENKITENVLEYINSNKEQVLLPDQDALNVVVGANWTQISPYWNFQTHSFFLEHDAFIKYFGGAFDISRVGIIHYTRGSKPWEQCYEPELDNLYIKYRKLTPWHDFHQEKDPNSMLKLHLRNTLRKAGLLWRLPEKWRVYLNK